MAFRYGTKFRRVFAQAVCADLNDRRALIERVLPPAEGGKRSLHLRTFADGDAAPRAIVAAWLADEITAEEAGDLLRKVEKAEDREQLCSPPRYPPWRERGELVNNNENTSAAAGGDGAGESRQAADPL